MEPYQVILGLANVQRREKDPAFCGPDLVLESRIEILGCVYDLHSTLGNAEAWCYLVQSYSQMPVLWVK